MVKEMSSENKPKTKPRKKKTNHLLNWYIHLDKGTRRWTDPFARRIPNASKKGELYVKEKFNAIFRRLMGGKKK